MINKISYIESSGTNPYENLAMEEYLLNNVEKDECILYLWQNRKTVVIGKNQNAWKECRVQELQKDGGFLVRRLSGGGAVFHDMGNLNFTFLVHAQYYDIQKQLDVILYAVHLLNINAEKTGRNDITVDGKKFSGNAFYETQKNCYHHGTIMVNVEIESLNKYLNVSELKLQSKGVKSVQSRVINLASCCEGLTVEKMKNCLAEAFEMIYRLPLKKREPLSMQLSELKEGYSKFSSWEWIFGRKIPFQYEQEARFPWGEITFQFQVQSGKIIEAGVYSDAMRQEMIGLIPEALRGCRFYGEDMEAVVQNLIIPGEMHEENESIRKDICILLSDRL